MIDKEAQRREWLRLKREDRAEFMENYEQERANYPDGFVPMAAIAMTGLIIAELLRDGFIVTDGNGGYAPA